MIMHIFKLIWNRKRSNLLMIVEIFFSFIVLFAIASMLIYNLSNYLKPLGFNYDNVWSLSLREVQFFADEKVKDPEDAAIKEQKIRQQQINVINQLKSYSQIEGFTLSSPNVPYSFTTMDNNVSYNNSNKINAFNYRVDDHFPDVLGVEVIEGRWFDKTDDASRLQPVVINQLLSEELFMGESPIGKTIDKSEQEFVVVGVVKDFRSKGEYEAPYGVTFERVNPNGENNWHFNNILIKVKPGVGAEFEEKMIKQLAQILPGWTLEISSLENMRKTQHKMSWIPTIALTIVGGFLIINVVLGLFGVLWYNINRRYSEIGLRRASGATSSKIQTQFLGEIMVLATFGLILGCFIALQFPLLNVFNISSGIYILAIIISILAIYLLSAICVWYPSEQASRIEPAVALHEE